MEPQKKVNQFYPNQDFGIIEDEYWSPVIIHGVTLNKYRVSNYGNVIGPANKKLKWMNNGPKRSQYPGVSLSCDPALLENSEYTYAPDKSRVNTVALNARVHVLVANAFLSLDDNLPEELNEYIEIDGQPKHLWSLFPDHTKLWIRSLLNVDHIDNDKGNPHVSNLTYVSPRQNQEYVKRQRLEGSN